MTNTTPTSGAAIQRYKIGYHADEWGQRSSAPSGIPDASGSWVRYADHVTALAAGQATAPQGVAYAALPEYGINTASHAHFRVLGFTADQMRAFADATHALRASHGQAPAGESLRTEALCDLSYSHGLKAGWNYCASDDLAGFERAQKIGTEALRTLKSHTAQQAPAGATAWRSAVLDLIDECPGLTMEQDHWLSRRVKELDLAPSSTAQAADSVQEDAALWHWLAEYLVGTRTDLDDEIVASETVNDLRKLVEAAIKQGATQ